MSFTTSAGLRAWRLDALDPKTFAGIHGLARTEAEARLARARREFADAACVRALLDRVSAPAIAALGVLVDAGGLIEHDVLVEQVAERFGMTARAIEHGLTWLMAAPLIVPLASRDRDLVAVLDVAAASVSALACGLGVRAIDEGAVITVAADHDDGRALLATCMALCHHELKVTQGGAPHRAGLKRLAKQLGIAPETLEDDLVAAQDLGLVRINEDDVLQPSVTRVEAAAGGKFPHSQLLDAFVTALREGGRPLPVTAVTTWMTTAVRADGFARAIPTSHLARLPGIRRGHDGDLEVFEACPLPEAIATTITPSFEVFIAPEASLVHLVEVLGCAELVRIDRVIVARLTKASLRRATATGSTAEQILARLARASRTPVPQNVEASIVDWAGDTIHATTAFGRVIAVAADAHDRTASALATLAPQVVARGVFVVDADIPATTVSRLLDKAGIAERRGGDEALDDEPISRTPIAYPPLRTGDRDLQRRIAAYRAGDPAERARSPHENCSCASHAHQDDEAFEVSEEAMDRVERWEHAHEPLDNEQATIFAALCDVVKPVDREFLLKAKTARDLVQRLEIVMTERDGLADLMRAHRAAFERHLPAVIEQVARSGAVVPLAELEWLRTDVMAHLTAAERTRSTLALDLGRGVPRVARILRVAPQGRVLMLFAEDVTDESSIAVPVSSVRGVAEPPPPASDSRPGRWRPVAGQQPPPGHVACPCGSGRKYRACCREAVLPS